MTSHAYGAPVRWEPARPRFRPLHIALGWILSAASLYVAAALLPGVTLDARRASFLVAAAIAVINAVLPPLLAALRLPFTLALGFLLVLLADAAALLLADEALPGQFITVNSFGDALLAALVMAAVSIVLAGDRRAPTTTTSTSLRVIQRIARRQGDARLAPTRRGSSSSRSTGSRCRCCATRCATAARPTMARWIAEDGYQLAEWEPDLSSQTGASQAGILLGSNEDIPAFRWVEKETGTLMTCSAPADCAEIERRHATGAGLLVDGGASRGNLLSGEADEVILTVSRMEAEKRANPGYRAFFANGFNVTRALVLFVWEVVLEWTAAIRASAPRRAPARPPRRHLSAAARRDVRDRPRPGRVRRAHRHDARPPGGLRDVRELRRGRPPLRARARRHDGGAAQARPAVRPHRAGARLRARGRTRSSCSPTTARRRARPSSSATATASTTSSSARSRAAQVDDFMGGDEQTAMVGTRRQRGDRARRAKKRAEERRLRSRRGRARLGQPRAHLPDGGDAPADARGDRGAPPRADPGAARASARRLAARALRRATARSRSAPAAPTTSPTAGSRARTRSPPSRRPRRGHLLRTDGFAHVADIMVGSFYDPELDEGCAFEELISFHGGLGGPQTRPFILHPGAPAARPRSRSSAPRRCTSILLGWRRMLAGQAS